MLVQIGCSKDVGWLFFKDGWIRFSVSKGLKRVRFGGYSKDQLDDSIKL